MSPRSSDVRVVILDRPPVMCDTGNLHGILAERGVRAATVCWDEVDFGSLACRLPGLEAAPEDVAVLMVSRVWTRYRGPQLLHLLGEITSITESGYRVFNADLSGIDKWVAGCRLVRHGVPTPPTWLIDDVARLSTLYRKHGPMIVKPRTGRQGLGQVRIDETNVRWNEDGSIIGHAESAVWESIRNYGTLICQKLVERPDREIRIAVVDDRPVVTMEWQPGPWLRSFRPSDELAGIAVAAVRAMGWRYGELDVLEHDGQLSVIDVNPVVNGDMPSRISDLPDPFAGLKALADLLVAPVTGDHRGQGGPQTTEVGAG